MIWGRRQNLFNSRRYRLRRNTSSAPIMKEEGRGWRIFFRSFNIILAACVVAFGYFFLFSDYYRIKNISLEGFRNISAQDVLEISQRHLDGYKLAGLIPAKNIFLYRTQDLKNLLGQSYLFAELRINKIMPDTIHISVIERNPRFILSSPGHEYLVDDLGVIIKRETGLSGRPSILTITTAEEKVALNPEIVTLTNDREFPVLSFETDQNPGIGQEILSQADIVYLGNLVSLFNRKYFNVKLISLPESNPEYVNLITDKGFKILLNLKDDAVKQFDRLDLVIEKEITEARLKSLDYADLRLGENIFYKYKN